MFYDSNNIFAKILSGEIKSDIIHETEHFIVINDIFPKAPIHILFIPKGEYTDFQDFCENASTEEFEDYFKGISQYAKSRGLSESGYRLIMNKGADANQTVKHFHCHLIAGKPLNDF